MKGKNPIQRCYLCGRTWGDGDPKDGYTDTLCPDDLQIIQIREARMKQEKEGNFPCCGTAYDFCDQPDCMHRRKCLRAGKVPRERVESAIEQLNAIARELMAREEAQRRELFGDGMRGGDLDRFR